MINVTAWQAFTKGLPSFMSPCILPFVPVYVANMGNRVTVQVADGMQPDGQSLLAYHFKLTLHDLVFIAGFNAVVCWFWPGRLSFNVLPNCFALQ